MKQILYSAAAFALAVGAALAVKAKSAGSSGLYYWEFTAIHRTALSYPINSIPPQTNPSPLCIGFGDNCCVAFFNYSKIATHVGSFNFYYYPVGVEVALFQATNLQ